jgi:M6 family metalloprotease-like protein
MSMPFAETPFVLTQPDGSTIHVIGTGNQAAATFTTLDGFTLVRDPVSHFYHYAQRGAGGALAPSGVRAGAADAEALDIAPGLLPEPVPGADLPPHAMRGILDSDSRWRARRAERQEGLRRSAAAAEAGVFLAPPERWTVGNFVGLTLLIDFSDHPATIARAEVERFCNQPGYSGFGNNGSVRDYFFDVSGGKLEYTNIVAPYYRARNPRDYYTDETVPSPTRAIELIREALDHLQASGFDASGLTSDDQEYVYALNVFYAGERDNNWAQGLWPHASSISPNGYQIAPGKILHDYQITDMTDELSLGTFCHENGHLICDFPDLYDYGEDGVRSKGVGVFCLMGAGGSGAARKNPAHVGAYLKHAAGWATDLIDLAADSTVTLQAGSNVFASLRYSPTEYILIESRVAAERDEALPGSGLAVWHIDELGSNENQRGSASSHYECALVQADGQRALERGLNYGDAGDLFQMGHTLSDTTNPHCRWWNGTESRITIQGISGAGAQMAFEVTRRPE